MSSFEELLIGEKQTPDLVQVFVTLAPGQTLTINYYVPEGHVMRKIAFSCEDTPVYTCRIVCVDDRRMVMESINSPSMKDKFMEYKPARMISRLHTTKVTNISAQDVPARGTMLASYIPIADYERWKKIAEKGEG